MNSEKGSQLSDDKELPIVLGMGHGEIRGLVAGGGELSNSRSVIRQIT
jgi:hypothetical protein